MTRETFQSPDIPAESGGATLAHWLEGARPRTWPNAFAPVLVGSAAAGLAGGFVWWQALLALVVAWSFIVGVNYANDYSDGIRGTDDERVGPLRLVGSGLAKPATVKRAAFAFLGLGGAAGLVLSATSAPWLILVGLACIFAAWFYTGVRVLRTGGRARHAVHPARVDYLVRGGRGRGGGQLLVRGQPHQQPA